MRWSGSVACRSPSSTATASATSRLPLPPPSSVRCSSSHSTPSALFAAATAAWPYAMPPSFAGSAAGTSTRSPSASSRPAVSAQQQPVLEHPAGEHDDVEPAADAAAAHAAAVAPASARWKRVAIVAGRHARARRRRGPRARAAARRGPAPSAYAPPASGSATASSSIAAWPSYVTVGPQPAQRRDRVEQPPHAGRDRRGEAALAASARPRPSVLGRTAARSASGTPSPRAPAATSHAHAIRHGSRAARSPPGSRTGQGARRARTPRRSPTRISPPQAVPSVPRPVPSKIAPTARPVTPCSARQAARCAWWCCTPTSRDALALERVGGREVVGVQVVRHHRGHDVEEALEVRDALAEERERLRVAQVADVVADPGAPALGEAERALELGAAGRAPGRGSRAGSASAPGTSPRERRRIVRRPPTIRTTESSVRVWIGRSWRRMRVRDRRQPRGRVVVAIGDRLVADVAARQHQRLARVGEQQVVQRRVREHHAELARAGRRGGGDARAPRSRGASTIGRAGDASSASSAGPSATSARAAATSAAISANGLSSRCLRARSRPTAVGVRRAAGEVVAADALDRDDRPGAQQAGGRRHRVAPRRVHRQHRPRPARGAGVRLRVEAAVARVVVLRAARRAHREARHRRQRAVVGHAADDREARPAVRAVHERVAEAPVGGVEELAQAVRARGHVGADERRGGARRARPRS